MVVVITICFPAGAARVGDWNSSQGLHPNRGLRSAEVVLRPTRSVRPTAADIPNTGAVASVWSEYGKKGNECVGCPGLGSWGCFVCCALYSCAGECWGNCFYS